MLQKLLQLSSNIDMCDILLLVQCKKMCVELDEGRIPNPLRLLVPDADED